MSEETRIERLKIEITEKVATEVASWLEKTDQVSGGLLLGNVYFQEKRSKIYGLARIEAMLPARHAEIIANRVWFTSATWQEWDRLRSSYDNMSVLGWVHSHPGSGARFTESDLTIQQTYFTKPWHIAWIVDPKAPSEAMYGWQQETIVAIPEWQTIQMTSGNLNSSQRSQNPPSWQEKTVQLPVVPPAIQPPPSGVILQSEPGRPNFFSVIAAPRLEQQDRLEQPDRLEPKNRAETSGTGTNAKTSGETPDDVPLICDFDASRSSSIARLRPAAQESAATVDRGRTTKPPFPKANPNGNAKAINERMGSSGFSIGKMLAIVFALIVATALATFGIYMIFGPK
ncbi:Mov34/MPN/PAD-1 family protein [Heliophilum fasciatum]|uniref:JAB1/Mov34/MPN/PAD-1 ubiquitin protease n=1 Tax=Heliophilum fasciatum TaxID=35700 RepID=A0A4R2RXF9_9FIRM|nr:Mov34/MPN/PAD-1 family protein [Heliophilum fasciatum]MCW2277151.1 proteasome lid subunit RPN8/RPN11 [Heliophilum fasciatum]TCP68213.1 JAB1/Mov34/MPN/PAD-1 ubiquitin protease [Heliophilum fasciatum]